MPRPATPAKPKRSRAEASRPARAFGRSLADFGELSPAERTLLECCRRGEVAEIADRRPEAETPANRVRADFVRLLALGGDEESPVHERGIHLKGAWLVDPFDLDHVVAERDIILEACRIETMSARQAKFKSLNLELSFLEKGLWGDRLTCEGSLFIRNGFKTKGEIRLLGVRVASDLALSGALLENEGARALSLDAAKIEGSLFLDRVESKGEIRLHEARVGGVLVLDGSEFRNPGDVALNGQGANVAGIFFIRWLGAVDGTLSLSGMRVGALCDDASSWLRARGNIRLDGFRYERFTGMAPTAASARVSWLDAQTPEDLLEDFRPQPWEQVISVLRTMGYPNEARAVAIAKQIRQRGAGKLPKGARAFHWLYGLLVGYGYRPMRLVGTTASIWLLCAAAYWAGTNPAWFGAKTHLLAPPAGESGRAPATDYRNFVPLIYSADVLLPVVDLGYKNEWQPVVADRAGNPLIWGQLLRFLYWFEIAFGWVAGLLLVGVLGNLIKKD